MGAGPGGPVGPAGVRGLLDLDHFKQYNDRHGRQAGDRFLKKAAAAWQAVVRRTDVVARADRALYAAKKAGCDRIRADGATAVEAAAP